MGIAYDGTNSTATRDSGAGTGTGAQTTPSFADETLVFAWVEVHFASGSADTISVTNSGDWTVLHTDSDAVRDLTLWLAYRVFDSTEAANYTWSWTNSDEWALQWHGFTGVDLSTPFDVTFSVGSHYVEAAVDTANANPASIANSDGATVVAMHHGQLVGQYTGFGAPSGYTMGVGGSSAAQWRFGACPQLSYKHSAGASEDPGAFTNTLTSPTSNRPSAWTFALKPALSGGIPLIDGGLVSG